MNDFIINEGIWHMKPIRTRFPKSMSRDTRRKDDLKRDNAR